MLVSTTITFYHSSWHDGAIEAYSFGPSAIYKPRFVQHVEGGTVRRFVSLQGQPYLHEGEM